KRLVPGGRGHPERRAGLGDAQHERVRDVVAVADVRDGDATKIGAFALADREDVGEALAGVRQIGEPVDDWDLAVARELLDRLVRIHAKHHRVGHAARDAGDVRDTLATAEADLRGRQVHAVATKLRDADVEREARAKARLLEDEGDRPAREASGGWPGLEGCAPFQEEVELFPLEIADREEVAHTRRDGHHGRARRRGRRSSTSRSSAVATRAASWRIVSCLSQRSRGPLHLSITGAVTARTPRSSTFASSAAVGSRYAIPRSA